MEVGDAVLDEQADKVEATDGEFTLGVWEDGTVSPCVSNGQYRNGRVARQGRTTRL
jgi:hypothetical protein